MRSILKSVDSAIGIGLGTSAGVIGIYSSSLPNHTDIRVSDPHNADVESQRKAAAIKSAVLIGAVFLLTRDRQVLILAGTVMVGLDYMVKHANGIDPATGRLDGSGAGESIANYEHPLADDNYMG